MRRVAVILLGGLIRLRDRIAATRLEYYRLRNAQNARRATKRDPFTKRYFVSGALRDSQEHGWRVAPVEK